MLVRLRTYVGHHHVGLLALTIALGGTSYAAATLPPRSVGTAQLKQNAVTSTKVKNGSLRRGEFARGESRAGGGGPGGGAGPAGPQGATGLQGPKGDTGTVDTSNFYSKAASDSRFLGAAAKAADADKLDGLDSTAFLDQSGALTARINGVAADSTDNGIAVRSYGAVSGLSAATGTLSSVETLSPARVMIARDLAMRYTNMAGAGNVNVVLMVDGVDTDYRCAIAGPAESNC